MVFLNGSKSVQVFNCCLYMHCQWRSSYQEGRVEIPFTGLTCTHLCTCSKPGPGFPMSYVVVFFRVQWVKVRGDNSLCWYWWNCWPSLFKLSFHNFNWIKHYQYMYYDLILILFLVFNATFSNISAISWRPVLLVEEARVPGENHRPWASNW